MTMKNIKKAKLKFDQPDIGLADQQITATARFSAEFAFGTITGLVKGSGIVGTASGAIVFNAVARQVSLESVRVNDLTFFGKSAIISTINTFLDALLPLVNVALDVGLNQDPQKALVAWLDQKTLINEDLQKASTRTLTFSPKTIQTGMTINVSSALVEPRNVLLAAKVDFVAPKDMPKKIVSLPANSELVDIPADQAKQKIADYQAALRAKLVAALGSGFSAKNTATTPTVGLTKEAASRAINHALSQAPVHATAILNELVRDKTDLTDGTKERNCQDMIRGCKYKDVCDTRSICFTEKVAKLPTRHVRQLGAGLPNIKDDPITEQSASQVRGRVRHNYAEILERIANANCDGFIAWDKENRGRLVR